MRPPIWALAGLLYAAGAQAAVTLTWQANTEADLNGYAVQYATTCAGPWTDLATTGLQPTFLDTAHDSGAYRVAAFDTTGRKSVFTPCQQVAVVATRPGSLRSCVMLTDGIRQPNCRGFTSSASGTVKPSGKVTFR